jgi:hypothetical protein
MRATQCYGAGQAVCRCMLQHTSSKPLQQSRAAPRACWPVQWRFLGWACTARAHLEQQEAIPAGQASVPLPYLVRVRAFTGVQHRRWQCRGMPPRAWLHALCMAGRLLPGPCREACQALCMQAPAHGVPGGRARDDTSMAMLACPVSFLVMLVPLPRPRATASTRFLFDRHA